MHSYLVSFSIIANFITLGFCEVNESFRILYNSSTFNRVDELPILLDEEQTSSFFYTMSKDERIKYCNEAKDFAGLDAVTPIITHTPLKSITPYGTVLLECRTLPISYLYRESNYDDSISIIMQENRFFKYNYEVQITKSEPILYSKCKRSSEFQISVADLIDVIKSTSFANDRFKGILYTDNTADFLTIMGTIHFENRYLEDNRLSLLEENKAMQICTAAKKHLQKLAANVPVLQNDRVEPAQIFDFGDEIGDHVALHCPSFPSMYVYFKNPSIPYTKDFKIVLVQN